jgi:citrate lyase subunit gamma (acyl carrier protein)
MKMQIKKIASAGTMESSDAYVEIEPAEQLEVQLESVVYEQFGEDIHRVVCEVLKDNGVDGASVRVVDRGALECVIRARVETAILRGKGEV